MGLFQRTGKKPQRELAKNITVSLVKSLTQHYSKAQPATSKNKAKYRCTQWAQRKNIQLRTFMTYFVHFILMIAF